MTKIGVIMGSKSDLPTMKQCLEILEELGIKYEAKIISAHRTPTLMFDYAKEAKDRGIEIIIAGAGGAAHLPGMVASLTELPVIGVPIETKTLKGIDSLLSIVQMPGGVPVATVAIGGAKNAGILAAKIIALKDEKIANKIKEYRENMERMILDETI
ncbi:5-(carboxyamino)imidazole ribonucleotide mutase [uncultured Cetobacterium sp.]|uniref:5-(carboxyamino)imidazole ribonucleotide mutase n=1 Tax=uncultured Cetobacterium sp. TaxID=527638 RepID=UPI002623C8C2|nr:5-(carboxyamino)imidazole ribonucleotide mutase [uncultured Cetobacterium sp.]